MRTYVVRMTSPAIQIAIDANDPHLLCRFWAAALDYEVEDAHDQIEGLLADGALPVDEVVEIGGRKAFRAGAACRPRDGLDAGPRLYFQTVPEAKAGKNRVHLDIHSHLDAQAREAEVERLVGLGATRLWDGQQGPHTWVTLADPEGNEFCLA